MKCIYDFKTKIVLLALLTTISFGAFSGCATAYYYTEKAYDLDNRTIKAMYYENASAEDIKITRNLIKEMKKQGFIVVDEEDKANCGLFVSSEEPTYEYQGSYTSYSNVTSNTNVSGYVGSTYVSGTATTTTSVPTTYNYTYSVTYKKLYVSIACMEKNDKIQEAWEGFASATQYSYQDNSANHLKNIVGLMKYDSFTGYLGIANDKGIKHLEKNINRKHYLLIDTNIGFDLVPTNPKNVSLEAFGFKNNADSYSGGDLALSIPVNLRLGYLRKFKKAALGISGIYKMGNTGSMSGKASKYDCGYDDNSSCYDGETDIKYTGDKAGVELLTAYYYGRGNVFLGVNMLKDVGSKMVTTLVGTGLSNEVKFNDTYYNLRAGWGASVPNTNLDFYWDLTINLKGNDMFNTSFGMSIGAMYRL